MDFYFPDFYFKTNESLKFDFKLIEKKNKIQHLQLELIHPLQIIPLYRAQPSYKIPKSEFIILDGSLGQISIPTHCIRAERVWLNNVIVKDGGENSFVQQMILTAVSDVTNITVDYFPQLQEVMVPPKHKKIIQALQQCGFQVIEMSDRMIADTLTQSVTNPQSYIVLNFFLAKFYGIPVPTTVDSKYVLEPRSAYPVFTASEDLNPGFVMPAAVYDGIDAEFSLNQSQIYSQVAFLLDVELVYDQVNQNLTQLYILKDKYVTCVSKNEFLNLTNIFLTSQSAHLHDALRKHFTVQVLTDDEVVQKLRQILTGERDFERVFRFMFPNAKVNSYQYPYPGPQLPQLPQVIVEKSEELPPLVTEKDIAQMIVDENYFEAVVERERDEWERDRARQESPLKKQNALIKRVAIPKHKVIAPMCMKNNPVQVDRIKKLNDEVKCAGQHVRGVGIYVKSELQKQIMQHEHKFLESLREKAHKIEQGIETGSGFKNVQGRVHRQNIIKNLENIKQSFNQVAPKMKDEAMKELKAIEQKISEYKIQVTTPGIDSSELCSALQQLSTINFGALQRQAEKEVSTMQQKLEEKQKQAEIQTMATLKLQELREAFTKQVSFCSALKNMLDQKNKKIMESKVDLEILEQSCDKLMTQNKIMTIKLRDVRSRVDMQLSESEEDEKHKNIKNQISQKLESLSKEQMKVVQIPTHAKNFLEFCFTHISTEIEQKQHINNQAMQAYIKELQRHAELLTMTLKALEIEKVFLVQGKLEQLQRIESCDYRLKEDSD